MNDLWPKDIADSPREAPVALLRFQASKLGEKTGNFVEAEVELMSRTGPSDRPSRYLAAVGFPRDFMYAFLIVAPTLDNYRYPLFYVFHGAELYPAGFRVPKSIVDSMEIDLSPLRLEARFDLDFDAMDDLLSKQVKALGTPPQLPEELKAILGWAPPQLSDHIIYVAYDKEEFTTILAQILQARRTKKIVHGLLDQLPGLNPASTEL